MVYIAHEIDGYQKEQRQDKNLHVQQKKNINIGAQATYHYDGEEPHTTTSTTTPQAVPSRDNLHGFARVRFLLTGRFEPR